MVRAPNPKSFKRLGALGGLADVAGSAGSAGKSAKKASNAAAAASGFNPSSFSSISKKTGSLTDVGSTAAKKTDGLTGVGSTAAKKGDSLDTAGDAAKKAEKATAGKAAEAASDVNAKSMEKAGLLKKGSKFCAENPLICAAPFVLGAGLYIDKKLKDASDAARVCAGVCLPTNWDEYEQGDMDASELMYTTVADIQANDNEFSDADVPDPQPLCTANIPGCGEYCVDKCKDLNKYSGPGAGIIDGAKGVIGDLLAPLGDAKWWIIGGIVGLVVLMIVMSIMKK
tara:strand:+ start:81 stop:932 length:852 start_codon:yes stop_codon:yes gene_type:complete